MTSDDEKDLSRVVPSLKNRRSGVLLHLTSLPGPHGCGDLGPEAHAMARWLASTRSSWWQMLPVQPAGYGNSPYMATSAMAISPLLLSLERLAEEGRLSEADLAGAPPSQPGRVDFGESWAYREPRLRTAAASFFRDAGPEDRAAFETFRQEQSVWLDDFALFAAIKKSNPDSWTEWDIPLRTRRPEALEVARRAHQDEILFQCYVQWELEKQWQALRATCRQEGIGLIGDLPIFVAHESVDVWAHPEIFFLDEKSKPLFVAGVPPDYFSATGQRWGHPLYRWEELKKSGYSWWMERLRRSLALFDVVRLDHFIGFVRYWEIPVESETAVGGRYVEGPGEDFFHRCVEEFGHAPVIAEDLGMVTPEVTALRERFELPGMRVLQFAFGGDPRENPHLPHLHEVAAVAYTGTHDNDTSLGFYHDMLRRAQEPSGESARSELKLLRSYIGHELEEPHWDLIRLTLGSVARLAIIPAQDLLGLGSESRMNTPSEATGNWLWRLEPGALTEEVAERLRELNETYGRFADPPAS